jgi:streptogramin lyase
MEFVDGPLEEVLSKRADDVETLLEVRAWEVKESPTDLGYKVVEEWPKLPTGWKFGQVAGVAVDSQERYYVYHRGDEAPPLICFDRSGVHLRSWGKSAFDRPHMVKCDGDDNVWLIDDGGHVIYLYSPEGEVLKTLGNRGVPGMDGAHFDRPTDIAFGVDGGFYVSDGYGNRRVGRFDRSLDFLGQWGSEGEGKGQFVLPHAITTDPDGLVYVADRTKWRVEIFSPEGRFLRQWTHIGKPYGIVYVPDGHFYVCDGDNARVTKLDRTGKVVGFFGSPGSKSGQLTTAHDLAVAENGDILVAHLDGRAQLFIQK